jgi:hypothetical protein
VKVIGLIRTFREMMFGARRNWRVRIEIGNGIESAASKWLAAAETFESEPDSAARAESLDGFACVMRAGRIKFAGGNIHGRKICLVDAQQDEQCTRGDAGAIFCALN